MSSSLIVKCIESIYSEVGHNVISECIMRYGLDKDECETWMSELIACLATSASASASASASSEKAVKSKGKVVKSKGKGSKGMEATVSPVEAVESPVEAVVSYPFPFPFNKNRINDNGCHGLAYNHGLFNQCSKKKLDTGNYCKNCQKESDQSGQPSCGTIEARLSSDLLEYTDPKGRKPIAYLKVLEKQKYSVDTVKEFIMRENIEVEAIHFECNEQKRGRPKSKIVKQVEAATVEDLFATLVNDDTVSLADTEIMTDSEDEGESAEAVAAEAVRAEAVRVAAEAKKSELAAEKEARVSMRCEETEQKKCEKEAKAQQLAAEKEAKLQQLAAEKEAKQKEKEANAQQAAAEKEAKLQQLAAEKEAKAQQLAAEKEAKQKEKEAKLQQAAAEKEAKAQQLAAEKAAKAKQAAAEKEAKVKQAAAEKEAKVDKKVGKVGKKATKEVTVKAAAAPVASAAAVEAEEEEEEVSVRAILINGKKYLKSDSNMLYDPESQDAVGIYEPATNSIKALPEESDDELCEDEYESDN